MSIFSKIFDRIRNHGQAAAPQQTGTATSTAQAGQTPSQPSPVQASQQNASAGQQQSAAPQQNAGAGQQNAGAGQQQVDVEAVLNAMAEKNPQKLNWRTSIVDLMKLVGMASTLAERKELADELGYQGDKSDTAAMNIWLHKQVMARMAANGGKVPANLMH
jgi:hypothetical protein